MSAAEVHEDELHAFVDGELPKGRNTAVLAYLGRHPQEVGRLAAYATQKEELRAALEQERPVQDPATAELQRALARRLGTGFARRRWLRRAAVVALLLGAGWLANSLYQEHFAERLPHVVREAAQAHRIFGSDLTRPVELDATAISDLAAWFSERLGEPVEIPSLRAMGLNLVGGRLLAGDDGPVAQLIYEDGSGYRVTLCMSPGTGDGETELELVRLDGVTAGYWNQGELTFALVARGTEQQLLAIATELGADRPEHWL